MFGHTLPAARGNKPQPDVRNYNIRDLFRTALAAGAVNNSSADPVGGTRKATDTNTKLSVAGGQLAGAAGAAVNDGVWWPLQTRAAGNAFILTVTLPDTNGVLNVGLDADQTGAITDALQFAASGVLNVIPNGGAAVAVGAYTATTYRLVIVMKATGFYLFIQGGAFTNYTLLWISLSGSANAAPAFGIGSTGIAPSCQAVLNPVLKFKPVPISFDTFTRSNGALGSTETAGPDGQTVQSQPWSAGESSSWAIASNAAGNTPAAGSQLLTDPGLETWTDTTHLTNYTGVVAGTTTLNKDTTNMHGGSACARIDVDASNDNGQFYQAVGSAFDWQLVSVWAKTNTTTATATATDSGGTNLGASLTLTTSYQQFTRIVHASSATRGFKRLSAASHSLYFDDLSVQKLTFESCLADVQAGNKNVRARLGITLSAVGMAAGIVLCLDSDLAGYAKNYRLVWTDGVNLYIEECVAGSVASKQTTAITYSAGALLEVVNDGVNLTAFYNGAKVGSTQTMTDTPYTLAGMFCPNSGNTLDGFELWPVGANGEYAALGLY